MYFCVVSKPIHTHKTFDVVPTYLNILNSSSSSSSGGSSRSSGDISGSMDAYKTKKCRVDQRDGVPHRCSYAKNKKKETSDVKLLKSSVLQRKVLSKLHAS